MMQLSMHISKAGNGAALAWPQTASARNIPAIVLVTMRPPPRLKGFRMEMLGGWSGHYALRQWG
jgi:hypothetical protein